MRAALRYCRIGERLTWVTRLHYLEGCSLSTALVTGSTGLIGQEAVRRLAAEGHTVVGVDNDLRAYFFGQEASTAWARGRLTEELGDRYDHVTADVRDLDVLETVFVERGADIKVIVHAAAQPSHDWAAREPITDFSVNALGTMHMLELTRKHCPEAAFLFLSTNKVYGDTPNRLPLVEQDTRFEVDPHHTYAAHGIDESMSIDHSLHSIFGASKVAADVMVQEYGRYFGMNTACFRGGCLTGPGHSGAELHGFLNYLVKCVLIGREYRIFGYKGKQVRDNIHSADLVEAIIRFARAPRQGEVYNMGGGRTSNCSLAEALEIAEKVTGKKAVSTYLDDNRSGDHIWWISDTRKFEAHYPGWKVTRNCEAIIQEIAAGLEGRL
jgi:CDP-paratose 2-epimerase